MTRYSAPSAVDFDRVSNLRFTDYRGLTRQMFTIFCRLSGFQPREIGQHGAFSCRPDRIGSTNLLDRTNRHTR